MKLALGNKDRKILGGFSLFSIVVKIFLSFIEHEFKYFHIKKGIKIMKKVVREVLENVMAIGMLMYWAYAAIMVAEQGAWCIIPDDMMEVVILVTMVSAGLLSVWKEVNNVRTFLVAYEEAKLAGLIAK